MDRRLALAFGLIALWGCGGRKPEQPAAAVDVDPKLCRACHTTIFDSYQRTGMARAFAPATADTPANTDFPHNKSNRFYQVIYRDGRIYQRRWEVAPDGKQSNAFELEATHIVGSGNHARTFLHRTTSGDFIELPLSWYALENRWAMSPGFDSPSPPDFTRIVDSRCLFCHNGYPSASGSLATGIDCQRCHGPGSKHIELAASGKSKEEASAAIVNPARLDAERKLDVCMQCHLETTSSELPAQVRRFGRSINSFRPGERLADYAVYFDDDRAEKFEVVNQAYRMRQSACFLKSAGQLSCTSCHNPHDIPRGEAAITHFRQKCMACHPAVKSSGHPALANANCAGCHMPRRRTEDAVHVAMTDHKIQRRAPSGNPMRPLEEVHHSGRPALYYPQSLPQPDADLYLGVALIAGGADRAGGIAKLEPHAMQKPPGGALAVLGEAYLAGGHADRAIGAFTAALASDPSLPKARYNLGKAYEAAGRDAEARTAFEQSSPLAEAELALGNLSLKAGDVPGAIARFRKALAMRPIYPEAHGNLGSALADSGNLPEARTALEQAIRIDPTQSNAHNNLGRVLAMQGALQEAVVHLRRAVRQNPKDVRSRFNLARVLQESNAMDAAIAEYRQAIAIDPAFADAHLALGQAYGDMGRLDAAIGEFREVLRLMPGHPHAQKMLEMAQAMKSSGGR